MSRLADLSVGGRGEIVRVVGSDEIAVRLLEMGLTPGAEIVLLGAAPLGDPLEFEVRGYHLSIRKCEAARIEIESP